jgi:NADH dehydrogenase FAD-containing subunit
MSNIVEKENFLLKNKIIPKVAVCGAGASGIELAFSFKSRWTKLFGQPIDVTIITSRSNVLEGYNYETLS